MMRFLGRPWLVAGLAMVLLAVGLQARRDRSERGAGPAAPPVAASAVDGHASGPGGHASPPASAGETGSESAAVRESWAPLPPLDQPFSAIAEELQRRATSGDAAAACRLAAEIDRCQQVAEQLAALESRLRWRQSNPEQAARQRRRDGDDVAFLAQRSDELLSAQAQCEGSAVFTPAQKILWLRQAALSGHLPSLSEYAGGHAFRRADTLRSLDALATYRNEAETLARRAADAGDAGMLLQLAQAYSPMESGGSGGLLRQAVEQDVVQSLSLFLHYQSLAAGADLPARERRRLDDQVARLFQSASPAQQAEARSLAQQRGSAWTPAVVDGDGKPLLPAGRPRRLGREDCDPSWPAARGRRPAS